MTEPLITPLVKLRSRHFLAQTGDKKSIQSLLESIGDPDPQIAKYSLDAVFNTPQAYQELMNPESLNRLRVIHLFSENDPEKAIQFSLDSLAQEDMNLKLLALDVLDCNIAYLKPHLELHLRKMLHDSEERVRVKASRLLVLLANYEDIDLSDGRATQILEAALDSEDLFCRRMAYGMPASVFYKIKNVKSSLDLLEKQVSRQKSELHQKRNEIQELSQQFKKQQQYYRQLEHQLESLQDANTLLQNKINSFEDVLSERDKIIHKQNEEKDLLLRQHESHKATLKKERQARSNEVDHARDMYNALVNDFQAREDKFKHQAYDFYTQVSGMFKSLLEEKEALLAELEAHYDLD